MRALIVFISLGFMLTACGFKGPLYLPKPSASNPSTASSASATASASAASSVQ